MALIDAEFCGPMTSYPTKDAGRIAKRNSLICFRIRFHDISRFPFLPI